MSLDKLTYFFRLYRSLREITSRRRAAYLAYERVYGRLSGVR